MAQMMAVIDVHMAALIKIAGCNEFDWYRILQVDLTSDEATIKKQYRKLALFLHPDKNKFSGAESAFKLVGEASHVLSDKMRRAVYDGKRRLAQTRANPLASSREKRSKEFERQQGMCNVVFRQTARKLHPFLFLTSCPHCQMKYQYMRKFHNRNLRCMKCGMSYIAKDLHQGDSMEASFAVAGEQKNVCTASKGFTHGCHDSIDPNNRTKVEDFFTESRPEGELQSRSHEVETAGKQNLDTGGHLKSYNSSHSKEQDKQIGISFSGEPEIKFNENITESLKFRKLQGDQHDEQHGVTFMQKGETDRGRDSGTSNCLKPVELDRVSQTTQNEVEVPWREGSGNKLASRLHDCSRSINLDKDHKIKHNGAKVLKDQHFHEEGCELIKSTISEMEHHVNQRGSTTLKEDEVQERVRKLLDSEFRKKWAKQNQAPTQEVKCSSSQRKLSEESRITVKRQKRSAERFQESQHHYRSKKVRSSFDVQMKLEKKKEHLKILNHQDTSSKEMLCMDNAQVKPVNNGIAKVHLRVKRYRKKHSRSDDSDTEDYKRKCEDMAVKWKIEGQPRRSSRPKRNVTYDYNDSDDDFQPTPQCKKLTAEELANLSEEAMKANLDLEKATVYTAGYQAEVQAVEDGGEKPPDKETESDSCMDEVSASNFAIPDADFFNFDKDREEKNVEVGQVWALYDDKDGMPRYYMKIKAVQSRSPFKVLVIWFKVRNSHKQLCKLQDLGYSVTCGEFKTCFSQVMKSVNSFSHLVTWRRVGQNMIKVYPMKGQTWCLYEDWKEGQKNLNPKSVRLKYCLAEVVADCDEVDGVTVLLLEKIEGFKVLYGFKSRRFLGIPFPEIFRFSHQVPARKLTGNEAPNVPSGCWELDPAAVPLSLL
ncbi:hypothetical protein KP509_35G054500 [Ceratopteris richardii]|nr:hypothetical protein KP509_35G054500 [Ceratopteris richardii]